MIEIKQMEEFIKSQISLLQKTNEIEKKTYYWQGLYFAFNICLQTCQYIQEIRVEKDRSLLYPKG